MLIQLATVEAATSFFNGLVLSELNVITSEPIVTFADVLLIGPSDQGSALTSAETGPAGSNGTG